MGRRVLVIAAVLLVLGFAYYGYTNYDAGRAASSGEVYSNDPPTGRGKTSAAPPSPAPPDPRSTNPETIVYPTEQSTNPSASTAQSDGASAPTDQTTRP